MTAPVKIGISPRLHIDDADFSLEITIDPRNMRQPGSEAEKAALLERWLATRLRDPLAALSDWIEHRLAEPDRPVPAGEPTPTHSSAGCRVHVSAADAN